MQIGEIEEIGVIEPLTIPIAVPVPSETELEGTGVVAEAIPA